LAIGGDREPDPAPGGERPGVWLGWWESRPAGTQIAIVLPVAVVAMFAFHRGLFPHLPLPLDVTYAVFWGAVLTALVVVATRSEAARRRRDHPGGDDGDDRPNDG